MLGKGLEGRPLLRDAGELAGTFAVLRAITGERRLLVLEPIQFLEAHDLGDDAVFARVFLLLELLGRGDGAGSVGNCGKLPARDRVAPYIPLAVEHVLRRG